MQVDNQTPLAAEALPLFGPDDRPSIAVVVKGTFTLVPNEAAVPAEEQLPIAFADEPAGEKGDAKWESDIAPFKPRADIVVVGAVQTPGKQPAQTLEASIRVGRVQHTIRAFGTREWRKRGRLDLPEPFTRIELSAENAFGGIAPSGDFCAENPMGKGFFVAGGKQDGTGIELPQLESPREPIRSWTNHPKPVGLGVYPRMAKPRLDYLGTYDKNWREKRSPLPPEDFRFDYHNCAYPELQVEGYLRGDEEFELTHLNREGRLSGRLPGITPSAVVERFPTDVPGVAGSPNFADRPPAGKPSAPVTLNLDTLLLFPDDGRCCLVWRGLCPVADLTIPEVKKVTISGVG